MHMHRFLPILTCLLLTLPCHAQPIDLATLIPPGKWALAYNRIGEFKPLKFKHRENGTSYTCIEGDPRVKIVNWLNSKGCRIDKESSDQYVYRLEGECRLKWWKSHPIPVSVELRPETTNRFHLHIITLDDPLISFTEQTAASLQGPCDPQLPEKLPST